MQGVDSYWALGQMACLHNALCEGAAWGAVVEAGGCTRRRHVIGCYIRKMLDE